MNTKHHEEQRRNFAITKAKLENMKPDPSISIDDFISKMLVSPSNKGKNTPRLPSCSTDYSTIANSQIKSPQFAPSDENLSYFPDVWDNIKSSSSINGLNGVKDPVNNDTTINGDDFDEFTSFSSSFISTNLNPKSENNFELSQPSISSNVTSLVQQLSPMSTKSVVESVDEFSDFVSPQKPNLTNNDHQNQYNVVNFANGDVFGSPSPSKAWSSVEFFEPLSSADTNVKELVVESTSQIAQVQVQPDTTTAATVDEDGFEDFQGCTFESAPPPTIPDEHPQKELPTDGWLKCLTECRGMLSESAAVLSPLMSDSDTDAFLSTPRGCDFIYELIEIYGICQRIRLAASINNILDPQLQKIFNQIDQAWNDLEKFVKNQEHVQTLRSRLAESLKATSPDVDALSVEPNCGVCVTPVSSSNGPGLGSAVISLAGRLYHASCANLWVNRIEFSLPSLLQAKTEEKQIESSTRMPDQKSVEMLEAFVKRLTAANETLALSVAQLSILIDLELQQLRQIYKDLGMSNIPEDFTPEEWLLAIESGSFPSSPRLKEESQSESGDEADLRPRFEKEVEEIKVVKEEAKLESPIKSPPPSPSRDLGSPKPEKPLKPESPLVDPFAFYFDNVAATIRKKHNENISDEWLRSRLAAKWASLSEEEKTAWQKAAEASSSSNHAS